MGSKFGWLLAGVLVLVVVVIIVVRLVFPPTTPPDKTKRGQLLDFKDIPFWPTTAAGAKPSAAGDAADDYRKAVEACMGKAKQISEMSAAFGEKERAFTPEMLDFMKEVYEHVARGAQKASASYAVKYADQFRIAPGFLPASRLKAVGDVLLFLFGHYYFNKDFDKAEEVARNTFKMGWHLMKERAHVNVVLAGLQLQMQGLGNFEALYESSPKKDPRAYKEARGYLEELNLIRDQYGKKLEIVHAEKLNAGDIFNIAENDKDHAWQVQAVQTLALIKHAAGGRADRRHARKLISRFSLSDDRLLSAAAKAAAAFTEQDFEVYRSPGYVPVSWPPGSESIR